MRKCSEASAHPVKPMSDLYRGFSHPVAVELSPEARGDLFNQMHHAADRLRANPAHVADDDKVEFRMLQRIYGDHLTRKQWLDLYGEWRDLYRARCEAIEAEKRARIAKLCERRDELFAERAVAPPQHHAAINARLMVVGRELAALQPTFPAAPLGEWPNSTP